MKATIERNNLINLTRLIVKDLISSSLTAGRSIDEDSQNAIHLNNYLSLIDRVLKHGLKQNLLSNRTSSLWNVLDKCCLNEATLMSESVRSLKNTKSSDGKIKAWIRLAMMQKRMPEYFNELLANRDLLLKDIYHDYAFMLNDEAHVFAGLIIGVNVIDCNFFAKDANFDAMDDVIDLSPYLDSNQCSHQQSDTGNEVQSMKLVLDQKNYLEERNKKLEDTISDLQNKIKSLEDQNSKLEMEAKVSEIQIQKLRHLESSDSSSMPIADLLNKIIPIQQEVSSSIETAHSKTQTSPAPGPAKDQDLDAPPSPEAHDAEVKLEAQRKLIEEREEELKNLKERVAILESSYRSSLEKIKTLSRDLDVQTSMNADKENTIKIYERDIKEKQAQVESLRISNSDLSKNLDETSTKLKERVKNLSNLQASLDKWKLENKTLAVRLQDKQNSMGSVKAELEKALATINELRKYNEKVNDDLKRERERGQSSSVVVETQNAKIAELAKRCQEYEQSLEEIGIQLREARLEVENLKENSAVFLDSQWMDSKQVKACALCEQTFSVTRRKHHCRLCGNVFCQTCSDNKMELASSSRPARVCDTCHSFLLAKFVKQSSNST